MKYLEYYDEVDNYTNKQELLSDKIENLFFKDRNRNYIINEGKMYYLINKSSLPKEISDALVGGDSKEYALYTRLIDVYGVTNDLKVYYCNSETGTTYGKVDVETLDASQPVQSINDDPEARSFFENVLADMGIYVDESLGITNGNLSVIKDLVIDKNTSSLKDLNVIGELKSLKTLTIINFNLTDLSGLEGCPGLYYIYFKNCDIEDYSNLTNVYNLQYLYFYLPAGMTEEIANKQIKNLGNGLSNAERLTSLDYLGISGVTDYFEKNSTYAWSYQGDNDKHIFNSSTRSNLSDLSGLGEFNDAIKNNLSYLYLHCNNIKSIKCLSNFSSITELILNSNSGLTSLDGLEEHYSIERLAAHNCNLNSISALNVKEENASKLQILTVQNNNLLSNLKGIENATHIVRLLANNCNLTDISGLAKHNTNLVNLDLSNNVNLKKVSTLGKCVKVVKLYLAGNENMIETEVRDALANSETHILKNCGSNYTLPGKYLKYFNDVSNSINYSYANLGKLLTGVDDEFATLKYKSQITRLNISGQTQITETVLTDVLSTLYNLEYISLNGCTGLTTLDFIKGEKGTSNNFTNPLTKIVELDVRNSGISGDDLTVLENYNSKLQTLAISVVDFVPKNIQKTINQLGLCTNVDLNDSWISKTHWKIRGFVVENNLTSGASVPVISFAGCDNTILRNFKSEGDYCKNICYDLSGLESLDNFYIDCGYVDFVFPKIIKEKLWLATPKGNLDFSKCSEITNFGFTESRYVGQITYPTTPITIHGYFNLTRSNVGKDFDFKKLINTSGDFVVDLGCGNTDPNSLTGIEPLAPFSDDCFKELKITCGFFTTNILEIDLTNKSSIEISGIDGAKTLRFINTNSTLDSLTVTKTSFNRCEGLSNISNLKNLTFNNSGLTDADLVYNCLKLSYLDLSNNNLADLTALNSLVRTNETSLTNVILNNNNLSVTNFENVNNITIFKNLYYGGLRNVNLQNNNFKSGEIDELVQLYGSGLKINYI